MQIILTLIYAIIGGFGGHLTRPLMVREFAKDGHFGGWFAILSYSIGVVLAFPFIDAMHGHLGELKDRRAQLGAAYFLGFLGVGIGTVLGHWLVPDE